MANVENFPNILPENVVSVNILNKTDNEIIAEEELFEAGIKTKLLVKHTIKPYSEHIIEIIDGDAEGTKITQYFESSGSQTKLTTNVDLNVKGATSLIAFLPEANLVHAINTVISLFVTGRLMKRVFYISLHYSETAKLQNKILDLHYLLLRK